MSSHSERSSQPILMRPCITFPRSDLTRLEKDITPYYTSHTFNLNLVTENRAGILMFQSLPVSAYDTGATLAHQIGCISKRRSNILSIQKWALRCVAYTGKIKQITFTDADTESGYVLSKIPIAVIKSRRDEYLTHILQHPNIVLTACELRQLYAGFQTRSLSHISVKPSIRKAIIIRHEYSKSAAAIVFSAVLIVSMTAGALIAVLTGKYEIGVGVTAAIISIITVLQGFL